MNYGHAKKLRELIEHTSASLSDEEALTGVELSRHGNLMQVIRQATE